ncbi:MAG: AEC family transporter [Anaerolineae bacterium]|nr:AEC family transporter [Anaerolineae bacterium]
MFTPFEVAYSVITPIFLVVLAGAYLGRRLRLDARTLSNLIIYLFTPCLIIQGISTTSLEGDEIGQIALFVTLISVILAALATLLARLFHYERQTESAFVLSVFTMNAANYGIPFNEFAFGEAARDRALLYYLSTAVLANTLGIFIISRGNASSRQAFLNVFRVPLIYVTVFAFALNATDSRLPLPFERAVALLGDATIPAMLLVLGFQLSRSSVRDKLRAVALAVGLRLILGPLLALGLVMLMGLEGLTRDVMIVQSGMPTAVMAGVFAVEFRSDPEFATTVILVSTLASILTLSILLSLLGA